MNTSKKTGFFSSVASLLLATLLGVTPPLLAFSTTGCGAAVIPNTEIPDTPENRRIVGFCEKYRSAVQEKDIDGLLSMASLQYFETGGNAKTADDMDINGLKKYLAEQFKSTKAIRYEIRYHRVGISEDRRVVFVDYTYTASYQIPSQDGDVWHRAVRDNRLQLVREGESFKILSGM